MNSRTLILLCLGTAMTTSGFAQNVVDRKLTWSGPSATTNERSASPLQVTFEKAWIDASRQDLPYFAETIPLGKGATGFTAYLENTFYQDLTSQEVKALPGLSTVNGEVEMIQRIGWASKRPYALMTIVPFRRSDNGGYQKLTSFQIRFEETRGQSSYQGAPKSPGQSVMASGDWYRFTVPRDGVYKLTGSFLQDLGIDLNGLASDQINIYGDHFGMLPFKNSELPETDLFLNAILVNDGGDGNFDLNDEILFYASGPQRWDWDQAQQRFRHTSHVYSDSASYFIALGVAPQKRINDLALSTSTPTHTTTSFNDRHFHEKDQVNLIKSGRQLFGESFDIVNSYDFNFDTPNMVSGDTVSLVVDVIARTHGGATASSSMRVTIGSVLDQSFSIQGVDAGNYTGLFARPKQQKYEFVAGQNNLPVNLTFVKDNPVTSVAWLNWLEVNVRRQLTMVGSQLMFRDTRSIGPGNVTEFRLEQAQTVQRIWDISDPTDVRSIPYIENGSTKSFTIETDSLREFIAIKNSGFLTPTAVGRASNQNIHGWQGQLDMVIVSAPQFLGEAQRLADRRTQDGLSVQIVTPQQVFNEFSSGTRDATAIKRMMKLLYDRAGTDPLALPRYLLLIGDGSYNNISLNSTNQNFIPTYQTDNSWDLSASYCTDDYFGFLDMNEGEATSDLVDIGVGRLPASSVGQARGMINKILAYNDLRLLDISGGECNLVEEGAVKDWRNRVMFISDDQEGSSIEGPVHMSNSNSLANKVEQTHPALNVDKIYMDAYQQISTPGGERYPDATEEFKNKVQKGLLLVNYVGHGGEVGWGHERFLDLNTILGWTNGSSPPLFMTATCEFSRWDDPGRTSAGEYVLLNANGGGIGLMTTSRLAYSAANQTLALFFFDHVFNKQEEQGRAMRFGDIYRATKRDIAAQQPGAKNHMNFCFLGDPSAILAQPVEQVITTSVTDTAGNPTDTLQALAHVRISGIVADASGQQLNDFNGIVVPTVYDKRVSITTLANDQPSTPWNYNMWKNVIYRGKTSVTNGAFSFTFVVPKDIAYQVAPGRISYYAESMSTNANGYSEDRVVGGTDPNALADDQGPQVELYMNDENFVMGGMTDASPYLIAKVFDANGINTLGSSIGHDIKAVLDERSERSVNLNDYYEADLDTYQSGQVRYQYNDLEEGLHRVDLKVWDVHNNSTNAFTEFMVTASEELALDHVLNYPNPFTTRTEFYFEHNKACAFLDVQVQVFTVSGRLVKTLDSRVHSPGFRSEPIVWNGLDDHGDKLGRGVYVYRMNVVTPEGEKAEKFEKLVILR